MLVESKDSLASQIVEVETSEENRNLCTFRSISILSEDLGFSSEREFIDYISGRTVLDVGSGYNGLAIDVNLQKIPSTVISVNPAINRPGFEEQQRERLRRITSLDEIRISEYTEEEVETARQWANKHTYKAYAHELSVFPDNSFDRVIDAYAVFYYACPGQSMVFRRSVQEMLRVSRNSIRAVVPFVFGNKGSYWQEAIFQELKLNYRLFGWGVEIIKQLAV